MAEDLWRLVENAFWYAGSRESAISEADRIFRKWFPQLPAGYIAERTCEIHFERLSREKLDALELRHSADQPQFGHGTIVIIAHDSRLYVVDGTKRVNRWKVHNVAETNDAVVISRKHDG